MKFHKNEIFPMNLLFITEEKEYLAVMRDSGITEPFPNMGEAATLAADTPDQGLIILVLLGEHASLPKETVAAILAHESVHVKQFLFDAIGEDTPGVETEAYLVEFYTRYLLTELKKREDKKTKKTTKK